MTNLIPIEITLQVLGVIFLIFLSVKGIYFLLKRLPKIKIKNPLKEYIKKTVIQYLKELQK